MDSVLTHKRLRLSAPVRIFNHYIFLPVLLLAALELLLLFLSVFAAAHLRLGSQDELTSNLFGPLFPRALVYALLTFSALVSMGLYHTRQSVRMFGVAVRLLLGTSMGMAATGLAVYLFPDLFLGRGVLAVSGLLSFLSLLSARFVFSRLLDDEIFKRRVLVFGAGQRAASVARLKGRIDQRGFRVIGYVVCEGEKISVDEADVIRLHLPLREFVQAADIDEIVVAMDDRRRAFPIRELLDCRLAGLPVVDLVSFLERETGRVSLDVLNPSWLIFSGGFRKNAAWGAIERLFDLMAALLLSVVSLPIQLLASVAIKLEDGLEASVLYRQARVGQDGKIFQLLKFRSMREDAEADGSPRWAADRDDRITRVGSVLRRYRLDELPQLWNVLKGDMSFVGPRPERPEFVEELSDVLPYYGERHCVKPGITGWAQLCYSYGASREDALEKLQYDLYYVKNHNLIFDLMILLQTAEVVLWSKGAR